MSTFRRLISELHRRSVWQVLLVYVGGALLGYQAVQALTEGLGLPQWFPALAVLLFIVGLPIVLATSFGRAVPGRDQGPRRISISLTYCPCSIPAKPTAPSSTYGD